MFRTILKPGGLYKKMGKINYNGKKFRAVSNSDNGEVSENMLFHYKQVENVLTCDYEGESILKGHLIGIVDDAGRIDMRYHHINRNGELMTGKCQSTPVLLESGKIKLLEEWQWTSGDQSKGSSVLEEI